MLYEWFAGNNRIHHELIKLSDANHRFKIPFKPEYGEGIIVSFTFVKEGELYITKYRTASATQPAVDHQADNLPGSFTSGK